MQPRSGLALEVDEHNDASLARGEPSDFFVHRRALFFAARRADPEVGAAASCSGRAPDCSSAAAVPRQTARDSNAVATP